jgi:hypothetical protein
LTTVLVVMVVVLIEGMFRVSVVVKDIVAVVAPGGAPN